MRNKFTGYFKGWDICEDCGQRLHRHGKTGLRHPVKSTGGRTGLQTHHFVLAKKAELSRPPSVSAAENQELKAEIEALERAYSFWKQRALRYENSIKALKDKLASM